MHTIFRTFEVNVSTLDNNQNIGAIIVKRLVLGWYWDAITFVFDPGEGDDCKVYLKFKSSLRTRMFSRGMDCNP